MIFGLNEHTLDQKRHMVNLIDLGLHYCKFKAIDWVSGKLKKRKLISESSQEVERVLVTAALRHSNFTKADKVVRVDLNLNLGHIHVQLCKHHIIILGLEAHVGQVRVVD